MNLQKILSLVNQAEESLHELKKAVRQLDLESVKVATPSVARLPLGTVPSDSLENTDGHIVTFQYPNDDGILCWRYLKVDGYNHDRKVLEGVLVSPEKFEGHFRQFKVCKTQNLKIVK